MPTTLEEDYFPSLASSPPTITLPLSRFLRYLWDYCSESSKFMSTRAIIAQSDGELIRMLDPTESQCHVEIVGDKAEVWEPKEWRNAYERRLAMDELKRLELEARERTAVYIDRLATAIAELAPTLDEEQLLALASNIIKRRLYNKAESLGVKIPKEEMLIV